MKAQVPAKKQEGGVRGRSHLPSSSHKSTDAGSSFSFEADVQNAALHPDGYSFANVSIAAQSQGNGLTSRLPIQAKLAMGQPNDPYEQEADRVAQRVVREINTSESAQSSQPEVIQPKPLSFQNGRSELQMNSSQSESTEETSAPSRLEDAIRQSQSGGRPMEGSIRRSMENSFRADLGQVRIHENANSEQLNQLLQSQAFTVGKHIFFSTKAYEPSSAVGQELLAHELSHVIQQTGLHTKQNENREQIKSQHNAEKYHISSGSGLRIQQAKGKKKAAAKKAKPVEKVEKAEDEEKPAKKPKSSKEFKKELQEKLYEDGWSPYSKDSQMSEAWYKLIDKSGNPYQTEKIVKKKLEEKTSNVLGKRSYEGDRTHQALRWGSTIMKTALDQMKKEPREVQMAALDHLYMSANTSQGLNGMDALVKKSRQKKSEEKETEVTGLDVIQAAVDELKDTPSDSLTTRQAKHLRKFKERIIPEKPDEKSASNYKNVREAFRKKVVVSRQGREGLHAERRIALEANLTTMESGQVGGIQRPCVVCAVHLYPDELNKIHTGPYWPSEASNVDFDPYEKQDVEQVAKAMKEIHATYLTEVKRYAPTTTQDTDSDSD